VPGNNNRQIDIPLALAIINSERLAKTKKVLNEAKRTINGSISKIIPGSFKKASFKESRISLSFDLEILRDSSIESIKKIKLADIKVQKTKEFKRLFKK
jgi:hypothetical protein